MSTLKKLEIPFIVNLEVTSQCNIDCYFCSAQLSQYRRRDLSTKDILKIISKVKNEGIYSIFITGGEPLLREDLPIIIKKCIDYGMNVSISTNAIPASKDLAKMLSSTGLEEIQVSIQGLNDIHDKIVAKIGAFKESMKGLKNLIKAGLRVTVASVVTVDNYNSIPLLAKTVAKMGAKYFRAQRLMPNSKEDLQKIVPFNEMKKFVKEMSVLGEETEDFTISVHTPPGFLAEGLFEPREHSIVHPLTHTCTAGKASMGILSDGECVPCLELKDKEFFCGNILDSSFNEIWDSKPMRLLRKAIPNNFTNQCGECEFRWTCYSARCVAYKINNDILGDDSSCYILSDKSLMKKNK